MALQGFAFQFSQNRVYRHYCQLLGIQDSKQVQKVSQIPYLPIEFFKTQQVVSVQATPTLYFESSSTTGQQVSKHYLHSPHIYRQSFSMGFAHFYGSIEGTCLLALLPSYLEREHSSLVYMCRGLMEQSRHPQSGFYLHNRQELFAVLQQQQAKNERTILLGATFALLDFSFAFSIEFPELIVMETGGMKGRGEELTRMEVHETLRKAFGVAHIHSEYGMTEMLSQAYAKSDGLFYTPPWLRLSTAQISDPLCPEQSGKTGLLRVMDLANIESCCFLQSSDVGRVHSDGSFEVLGRTDNSDVRGCSLLVA